MPATNYRLVFLYHHFLMLLDPFFVIFVCMYVCATHMHHSSSVIILVIFVHSRHVIVLSFASVSFDNCFGTCMVCLREWWEERDFIDWGWSGRRRMQNIWNKEEYWCKRLQMHSSTCHPLLTKLVGWWTYLAPECSSHERSQYVLGGFEGFRFLQAS
jgi:hypothetical protein